MCLPETTRSEHPNLQTLQEEAKRIAIKTNPAHELPNCPGSPGAFPRDNSPNLQHADPPWRPGDIPHGQLSNSPTCQLSMETRRPSPCKALHLLNLSTPAGDLTIHPIAISHTPPLPIYPCTPVYTTTHITLDPLLPHPLRSPPLSHQHKPP